MPMMAVLLAAGGAFMTSAGIASDNLAIVDGYAYDEASDTCENMHVDCQTNDTGEFCTTLDDDTPLYQIEETACPDRLYRVEL